MEGGSGGLGETRISMREDAGGPGQWVIDVAVPHLCQACFGVPSSTCYGNPLESLTKKGMRLVGQDADL